MKKRILITLILLFCFSLSTTYCQTPERNEIVTERHSNGLKKIVLMFEGTGVNETLIARYGFHDNGLKAFVQSIKDNKKDGKCTWWYENGQKEGEETYKDGKQDGLWTGWYENGQKEREGTFKDGELISVTYWDEDGIEISYTPPGMVYVEGGTFQMGSNSGNNNEKPVHTVTVSSFFIDKTEVTQAEYRQVMGLNPSFRVCDNCPVEHVSWYDASLYAKKVGKRLPTEAEWEFAARGGNKSKGYKYSGSNDLNEVGWYYKTSDVILEFGSTLPVALKQPNELGLYDMSGNVWEWCSNFYYDYSSSPQTDPQGPNSGDKRVLRGHSFVSGGDRLGLAHRQPTNPQLKRDYFSDYGFRCVSSTPH